MNEADPQARHIDSPKTRGASDRRLLILDDDDLVGMLVDTVARLAGLATRLTSHHEAFFLALAEWQPDLVLIDLTMPAMSGEDVLLDLAKRQCRARIIISSGSEPQRLAAASAMASANGLTLAGTLPKPFTPAKLRTLLAD